MALTQVIGKGLGTLGDGTANDVKIVFDGNAQDFHIGLDDSADSLTIGLGSALGTTSHMVFDANGHITKPLQPAFNATNNGTQSDIALATQVTVALGTERFDVNADFASDTFTAPVTGKYQLNVFIRIDNLDSAAHYYELRILTSNSGYGIILDPDFGQDQAYFNMSLAVLADMDASDTAKVELRQEGGTQQTDILDARFSGFLAC